MPQAAWCSACQKYVWVTPQGQCQNGHTMEFLSAYYDSIPAEPVACEVPPPSVDLSTPPRARSTTAVWVGAAAVFVALVAASAIVGAGLWIGTRAAIHTATQAADTPVLPRAAKTPDELIAEQYPGYRVEQRIALPDQWQKGKVGMNYLLVNVRQPKFRLMVSISPDDLDENVDSSYITTVDGMWSNDEVFSVAARSEHKEMTAAAQDAIIDAFVANKMKDAFLYNGWKYDDEYDFEIGIGDHALERAMKDANTDATWQAVARFPDPNSSKVSLEVHQGSQE